MTVEEYKKEIERIKIESDYIKNERDCIQNEDLPLFYKEKIVYDYTWRGVKKNFTVDKLTKSSFNIL